VVEPRVSRKIKTVAVKALVQLELLRKIDTPILCS
jgi:hypothetical protein